MDRAEIQRRRAEIETELALLNAEEERQLLLSDDILLAEGLHQAQCRWNHTDGCSWYYEIHGDVADWNRRSHADWLKKAHRVMRALPEMSTDDILKVLEAIK